MHIQKTVILLLGLSALFFIPKEHAAQPASVKTTGPFKVMTFNIRFANPGDNEYAWKHRKAMVAQTVQLHHPGLLGIQEGLHEQVKYLDKKLKNYSYTGCGRDDGKTSGEYSAIFYRHDRLELLQHGTFWLSETPGKPGSTSWGNSITRICTWGKFRDKITGREFYHFNTHWDHQSANSRKKSAELIAEKALEIAGDTLLYLSGDMNTTTDAEPIQTLLGNGFADTRKKAVLGHIGAGFTYVGFPYEPGGRTIDYVMVKNAPDALHVLLNATLTTHNNGYYPSDHLPVIALFQFDE